MSEADAGILLGYAESMRRSPPTTAELAAHRLGWEPVAGDYVYVALQAFHHRVYGKPLPGGHWAVARVLLRYTGTGDDYFVRLYNKDTGSWQLEIIGIDHLRPCAWPTD